MILEQRDPALPTAILLVNGFNGLGLATLTSIANLFPGQFRNLVFISVGEVDSALFKGPDEQTPFQINLRLAHSDRLQQASPPDHGASGLSEGSSNEPNGGARRSFRRLAAARRRLNSNACCGKVWPESLRLRRSIRQIERLDFDEPGSVNKSTYR